jgi:RND family efflux transporter MFP subunit
MFASLTALTSKLPALRRPGKWFYIALLGLLLAGASIAWYLAVYTPAQAVTESALQTAAVRQGELTLTATGSGTLTAPEEQLGFSDNGDMQVAGVYVNAGDLVQKGDVLAEVDSAQAQTDFDSARQNYLDLTGSSAIAAAAQALADAQAALQSEQSQLEYLISPDVMYWEGEVATAETALVKAQARLEASPSDDLAKKNLKDAQERLGFMQEKLSEAQKTYWKEYVPETFPIAVDGDTDTYYTPTEMELKQARQAIVDAKAGVKEAEELCAVLNGEPIPDDASNASLIAIEQAKSTMEAAQARLDGAEIVAPFAGTVMQVNIKGGDTVAVNTTESGVVEASNAILIADTSNPYLEVYWGESDWSLVKAGTAVEISFDDLDGQAFSGKITEVDSELSVSNGSSVVAGKVSLDSAYADLDLPVGASASVVVVAQRAENAVYIPAEALHDLGSGQYAVFVMTNGEPRVRTVEIGLETDSYVQVTSGLEAGDVVTTGLTKTK